MEFLLEVVQRAGGGPAAQRGYLRFVAQMADLMADYLRRQSLREHSQRSNRLQQFEYWLTTVAQTKQSSAQLRCVADAMADLLDSFQVLILRSGRTPRVLAVSGLEQFDPRSETILLACGVERVLARSTNDFSDEMSAVRLVAGTGEEQDSSASALQAALASDRIVRVRMDDDGEPGRDVGLRRAACRAGARRVAESCDRARRFGRCKCSRSRLDAQVVALSISNVWFEVATATKPLADLVDAGCTRCFGQRHCHVPSPTADLRHRSARS